MNNVGFLVSVIFIISIFFLLTLSTGRQIVTWGEGDGLSALDVINSQDQREPGVADIDDIKLAVWLSRLQVAQDKHSFEHVCVVHVDF